MGKKLMEQKKTKKALEAQIEALTAEVASLQEQNATFSSQVEMAQGAAAVVEGADSKLVEVSRSTIFPELNAETHCGAPSMSRLRS